MQWKKQNCCSILFAQVKKCKGEAASLPGASNHTMCSQNFVIAGKNFILLSQLLHPLSDLSLLCPQIASSWQPNNGMPSISLLRIAQVFHTVLLWFVNWILTPFI